MRNNKDNPLKSLISDDVFEQLINLNLINFKELRDFEIRKKYKDLRGQKFKSNDAIAAVHIEYKNLAYRTIRKIIYSN